MDKPAKLLARLGAGIDRIPARWQFIIFIILTLATSIGLTVVSYIMYVVTGTAQLDLSRPGYKQALSEVAPADTTDTYTFSGSGPLDASTLKDFKEKYDALVDKTKGYSAFDPNALSDEQLNLNDSGIVGPR